MAWVNKKYECSECGDLYDEWEDAKDCCATNWDFL